MFVKLNGAWPTNTWFQNRLKKVRLNDLSYTNSTQEHNNNSRNVHEYVALQKRPRNRTHNNKRK